MIMTKRFNFKIIFISLSLIIYTTELFSQEYFVTGVVKDAVKNEVIFGANAYVSRNGKILSGASTDVSGKFKIKNLDAGKYQINISCVGYKIFSKTFQIKNNNEDLKTIYLKQDTINLDEVVSFGKAIPVIQKDDTIEYNAAAFRVQVGADAGDLIDKLPGITVRDDKIQAHGKEVSKILIDGKPLYQSDKKATMQAVPADMVDKIQVYDKLSDESEFKGFDDGNKSTIIDIKTKPQFKNSRQTKLIAGFGNDDRYAGSANLIIMDDGDRYLASGDLGRIINSSALSMTSASNPGQAVKILSGWMAGESGLNYKNDSRSLRASLDKVINEKITVKGSISISHESKDDESSSYREYYLLPPMKQTSFDNSKATTSNTLYNSFWNITYQIDSTNIIRFSPTFNYTGNDYLNSSNGNTYSANSLLNSRNNTSQLDNGKYNLQGNILYNHKFEKKGRLFNLMLDINGSNNDNNKIALSERIITGISDLSDSIQQKMPQTDIERRFTVELGYIEPLSSLVQLQISSNYMRTSNKNDLHSYTKPVLNEIYSFDSSQSNYYERIYDQGFISARLYYKSGTFSISPTLKFKSTVFRNDSRYPEVYNINKHYNNFFPSINMSYSFNKTHNINLYYDIFELLPPADLLRAVPDFSDPLMITSGNPDLKPENMHLFFLSYMHTDPTNFSTFSAMINCNIGQDRLATSTIYSLRDTTLQNGINLAPGARYSTWKNVNGAYMFGAALNYSIPWDFIKSNLNCGVSYNINKNVSILNETENYTNNQNINFQFGLKTNISTDFSINLNTENKLIQGFNSLSNSITQKYFNQMTRINFLWNVSYDFIYTTDLNYLYNGILTGEKNPNIYYLDCGLSRKLFSQNQGEIRFAVYDIFDNSNSYSRVITGSFYQETRRNSLGRYYVFSFKYSLRNF